MCFVCLHGFYQYFLSIPDANDGGFKSTYLLHWTSNLTVVIQLCVCPVQCDFSILSFLFCITAVWHPHLSLVKHLIILGVKRQQCWRDEKLVDIFISFSRDSQDTTAKLEMQYKSQKKALCQSFLFPLELVLVLSLLFWLVVLTCLSAASLPLFSLTNPTATVCKHWMRFTWVEKAKWQLAC